MAKNPTPEIAIFSFPANGHVPADLTRRELKLTAILYGKLGAAEPLRRTGRLPDRIGGSWNWVPMNVVMRERGSARRLILTDDERLLLRAILREGRLPGGAVFLLPSDPPAVSTGRQNS